MHAVLRCTSSVAFDLSMTRETVTAQARDFGAIARSARHLAMWMWVVAGVVACIACTRSPPRYPNWQQCSPKNESGERVGRPAPDGDIRRALQLFLSDATRRTCGDVVGVAIEPAGALWNAYPCPLQNDHPPEPWRIDTASAQVYGGECGSSSGAAPGLRGGPSMKRPASASPADEGELLRAFEVAYRDAVAIGIVKPDTAYAASILLEGNTWFVYLYPPDFRDDAGNLYLFIDGDIQYLVERGSLRITWRSKWH